MCCSGNKEQPLAQTLKCPVVKDKICACTGGALEDAVGVCAHEIGDMQLALVVARLLTDAGHPDLVNSVLTEQLEGTQTDAS